MAEPFGKKRLGLLIAIVLMSRSGASMSLDIRNKYEIRHRALLEAMRICGGVTAYSKSINISRSRASNWLNRDEIEIPYEYVVLTEELTQVSIERLSPFTEMTNKVIRRLRSKEKHRQINIKLDEIIISNHPYLKYVQEGRPIIIGTDRVLISGLMQLRAHKTLKTNTVPVKILDLEALLLEMRSIEEININFLISEQVAIGLRIEELLGDRQGKRNDLHPNKKDRHTYEMTTLDRICDEVQDKGKVISRVAGFSSRNSYYRARQVYLHGNSELIDKLDKKELSIAMAAQQSKFSEDFNKTEFQQHFREVG